MGKRIIQSTFAGVLLSLISFPAAAQSVDNGGGASASYGSIATPRPINPAAGTTNPSARATQTLNPYLGSTPEGAVTEGEIKLSLQDAVDRGLRFNLGLIDSQQADASVRAQRERALAELLPQISARAEQTYEQLSFKSINIKLPPQAGFQVPPTSGAFGYQDARIVAQSAVFNAELINRYKSQKALEAASILSTKDARDVVVFAVGAAYFQVVASQARVATAQASLASTREFETQVSNQYKSEVSPEIDALRAQVELHTAEQRVVDATNDLEKDKLTLDRITGIPLKQAWRPSRDYDYTPLPEQDSDEKSALQTRADLASLKQTVAAAELGVKAARAQRVPSISFEATYGGAGTNPANYNQVYSVSGGVSVPIFTSGRIRSDVHEAEAALVQRRAEYRDLGGRVAYDVSVAELDAKASESAIKVSAENKALAQRALTQSQDRYTNGVTNYLEVVQAEEALVAANENYIASLFSFNVAKISLARALGSSEMRLPALFGNE
ncbi:MAG TPA: TolC family protein [Acidobacteriaceae bacterium]|nr:TolC family protein [Acidobacteriaceae bacterium]